MMDSHRSRESGAARELGSSGAEIKERMLVPWSQESQAWSRTPRNRHQNQNEVKKPSALASAHRSSYGPGGAKNGGKK